ncbi:IS1 family transposase [Lewinella aquimaris]|uniref:IS1 family transposase n=1 Tax=Neolewinella aquimaris TaxID=1835722 RepID=A0A840E4X3_9BACT|nr:IS1 family transposase [Neolewinella aquimaris]MBB4080231.1 IS1 family transposase [Neolewinella aquimaris]
MIIFKATKLLKMIICPNRHSSKVKKNGFTHYGKQNHKCKDCRRQFVLDNQHTIGDGLREVTRRLLSERISLRGICRVLGISIVWMLNFAVSIWAETSQDLDARQLYHLKGGQTLKILGFQADEMWSFVGTKQAKAWIWVGYDPLDPQVICFHIGGRGKDAAAALWTKIPARYRQYCTFATDYWEAYRSIIPPDRHVVGKAHTQNIEGIFATFRARVSRLVRRSLSFSRKWEKHEAAIGYFFWQFNLGGGVSQVMVPDVEPLANTHSLKNSTITSNTLLTWAFSLTSDIPPN